MFTLCSFLKAVVHHSPRSDCPPLAPGFPLASQHMTAGLSSLLLFSWLQLQGFEKQKQLEGLGVLQGTCSSRQRRKVKMTKNQRDQSKMRSRGRKKNHMGWRKMRAKKKEHWMCLRYAVTFLQHPFHKALSKAVLIREWKTSQGRQNLLKRLLFCSWKGSSVTLC